MAAGKHTTKGSALRTVLMTLVALAILAVGLITAGGARAADSAVATIGLLKAQGFDVRVDRGRGGDVVPVLVRQTVTVLLDCSRR